MENELVIHVCGCLVFFLFLFLVMTSLHAECEICVYFSQTSTTVYRTVLAHPVALCEIGSIELKNTGARFYRQGDIHVKSVCLTEFPSLRYGHTHIVLYNVYVKKIGIS